VRLRSACFSDMPGDRPATFLSSIKAETIFTSNLSSHLLHRRSGTVTLIACVCAWSWRKASPLRRHIFTHLHLHSRTRGTAQAIETCILAVGMTHRNSHRQGEHQGWPCRAVILISITVEFEVPWRAQTSRFSSAPRATVIRAAEFSVDHRAITVHWHDVPAAV
jgi:hypothetical protein